MKTQMAKLCALEAILRPNSLQGNKTDVIGIESKKILILVLGAGDNTLRI